MNKDNRLTLSIICQILKDADEENYFLDQLTLSCKDVNASFSKELYLSYNKWTRDNNVFREKRDFYLFSFDVFFKDHRFGRIDSCSIMFREHICVRSFYINATDNFTYKMQ